MHIFKETTIYSFSQTHSPVLSTTAPCHLTFETCDCFHGQITSAGQAIEELDFNRVNPATGPVFIEGAEPGDALCIRIDAIRTASQGIIVTAKGTGALPEHVAGKTMLCPIKEGHFLFHDIAIPLSPMIGVIGVAPAGDPVSCGLQGNHGGNMDTSGISEGAVLFLPVFVKGALLALGDLHAAMGDGEVGVSGLEVAGEVDLHVEVKKDWQIPCPLLLTRHELAFLASAATLDEAIQLSVLHMNTFLTRHSALDRDEALMLMSTCGQARISQIVDPLKTARFAMPLEILKKFTPGLVL